MQADQIKELTEAVAKDLSIDGSEDYSIDLDEVVLVDMN